MHCRGATNVNYKRSQNATTAITPKEVIIGLKNTLLPQENYRNISLLLSYSMSWDNPKQPFNLKINHLRRSRLFFAGKYNSIFFI